MGQCDHLQPRGWMQELESGPNSAQGDTSCMPMHVLVVVSQSGLEQLSSYAALWNLFNDQAVL